MIRLILSKHKIRTNLRDPQFLAEASKQVFGSVKKKSDFVCTDQVKSDAMSNPNTIEVNGNEVPEWVQALEPVRKLPTNVGARIRKCVHEALQKNPPEWAKKIMEHSISREVYKGNASGPTKVLFFFIFSLLTLA